ncbi:hypothetical protein HDU98_009573 [Podochytrium sp. JEL0797]|nr:hypothetical protein HDU98_009573 [Podochytrium sp. JEL0797]
MSYYTTSSNTAIDDHDLITSFKKLSSQDDMTTDTMNKSISELALGSTVMDSDSLDPYIESGSRGFVRGFHETLMMRDTRVAQPTASRNIHDRIKSAAVEVMKLSMMTLSVRDEGGESSDSESEVLQQGEAARSSSSPTRGISPRHRDR